MVASLSSKEMREVRQGGGVNPHWRRDPTMWDVLVWLYHDEISVLFVIWLIYANLVQLKL